MQRALCGVAVLAAALLASLPAGAADLALQRVVLSTGGVGYFEYAASVNGDATLTLDVPLDQVDDVLKSLVVYDQSGEAGEITLPGRQPLTQGFADLPFDRAALQSEVALLNALQGAEIRVGAPQPIAGRLIHAEKETMPGPGGVPETRTEISVLTDKGLRQFGLQNIDAIAFADPKLQQQIATALQRIVAYRATGRRELSLRLHGAGTRTVRVGYVVAAPLWKASYRLSLPDAPTNKTARLQGWAVLENMSGRAWHDVALTLVSGNPVTFRQALYESYYVPRPSVPVESGIRVLPPPDTGAVAAEARAKADHAMPQRFGAAVPPAPPPPMMAAAAVTPAQASDEATQVAFTPPYKVSVAAGQSLMLPLLDRDLPARRLDLFDPDVERRHPLAAIELANDSGNALPAGVVTLYRQAPGGAVYVGDSRLAATPSGDKRLLSYAVDNKVTVDRTTGERRPVVKATIADGVLHLTRANRWTTQYRVKSVGATAPSLLIEQKRIAGAKLTAPDAKNIEMTTDAYRIPLALPAQGETGLTVVQEQPVEEAIRLQNADDNRIGALAASDELDPQLRTALEGVAARRKTVARDRAALTQAKDSYDRLGADEKRLRDNLTALGNDPALRKRLLDQFSATETAIEAASAAIAKQSDALAAAERDLSAYIAGLRL